jgi:hypothetical protein
MNINYTSWTSLFWLPNAACLAEKQQILILPVVVSVLSLSAVDRGFEPLLGKISICCFSAKHAALGSQNRDVQDV